MTKKLFLIASSSLAAVSHDRIRSELVRRNHKCVVYLSDMVLSGQGKLALRLSPEGEISVFYDQQNISPNDVDGAWLWKVGHIHLYSKGNVGRELSIDGEIARWNETLWPLYEDQKWVNAPSRIRDAERKLQQLLTAKNVGFTVPPTLSCSSWSQVLDWMDSGNVGSTGQIAVKMLKGLLAVEDDLHCTFTTPLTRERIKEIESLTIPFPGLFQPFYNKSREWRVTVVGEDVFPASIYTTSEAKDDWRRLQLTGAVTFRNECLPEDIALKCRSFIKQMGLLFGAFDLIETNEGEFVFLECNPMGQYGWIEDSLGHPISIAIVNTMERLSNQ